MDIVSANINKSFGSLPVLVNLNLTFPEGKTTCLMGPSGCGKTTLANLLLGLLAADSGTITGLEKKRLSAVFQENRLCEAADALTNLRLVLPSVGKTSKNKFSARSAKLRYTDSELSAMLKEIGLTDFEGKPVSELSGGMKRRVAILRALIAESDILVLDEPFKGLDEALKEQVIQYVKNKTKGKTVILITHDPDEAAALQADIITLAAPVPQG